MSSTETMNMAETTPIIPKTCKAGVVCNPGPDFTVYQFKITVNYASHTDTSISD